MLVVTRAAAPLKIHQPGRGASVGEAVRLHPKQRNYFNSKARVNVVPSGRRAGKTMIAKRRLRRKALTFTGPAGTRFIAAAPIAPQARRIYWQDMLVLFPEWMRRDKPNKTDRVIPLINGADIQVMGMDQPARVEGSPVAHILLDEYANMKEEAWEENIYPALLDSQGTADLIGVPEGRNHYFRMYRRALTGAEPDWQAHHWTTAEVLSYYLGAEVAAREIATYKRIMDPMTYQQEFEGSFLNFQGRAYYCYDPTVHSVHRLQYNPNQPLILCFDFNIAPGICVYVQEQSWRRNDADFDSKMTCCIGEVWIPKGSNTKRICRKIIADWGARHQGLVYCYGDATGGVAKSQSVDGSDWDIVYKMLKAVFGDRLRMRVNKGNPEEKVRVNSVNARLRSADNMVHMLVDPVECPHLCDDLDGVMFLEGTDGELDKDTDPSMTHISDGLGYYIADKFPLGGGGSISQQPS